MAWNGSGTFSRVDGSTGWVDDRNAGTKIRADLHDTNDNDLATGINTCIAKDGQVTTTAAIPFAAGINMSDGTVGTPAIKFISDTNSGWYRIGADNVGLSLGGAKVVDYATTGVTVTGTLGNTSTAAGEIVTVTSTEAGASAGPGLALYRNSASPANSDVLGYVDFQGEDSGGGTDSYARITASISDVTATSEDGNLLLGVAVAGTLTTQITVAPTLVTITPAVTITGGPLTLTAGQISFPVVQNASADANTLDDYEEGTFTPTIAFGGAAVGVTYTTQAGRYTKIGRLVTFDLRVTLSAKGTSNGAVTIAALPFTSAATYYSMCSIQLDSLAGGTTVAHWTSAVGPSATSIAINYNTATAVNAMTDANATNTTDIIISGSYAV